MYSVSILIYFNFYCCGWNSFLSSVADSLSCPVTQNVQPPKSSPVVSTVVSGASSARTPASVNHLEPVASVTQPSELLKQKGIGEIHYTIQVAQVYIHTDSNSWFLNQTI